VAVPTRVHARVASAIPLFAQTEERIFGQGRDGPDGSGRESVQFGLAPAIIGIPIVALALSTGGLLRVVPCGVTRRRAGRTRR
jgi:hypothetical protein